MIRTPTSPLYSALATVPRKFKSSGIKALIDDAWWKQGIRISPARRHEFKGVHGFRKFFQTHAEPRMKSLDVMTLMGQDTGLAASYNKPTVEMLLTEYLKAVDNLTIDKTGRINDDVVRNQQTLSARIEEKDQEVNKLKEQMGKMQELVEELNHAISFYKPG